MTQGPLPGTSIFFPLDGGSTPSCGAVSVQPFAQYVPDGSQDSNSGVMLQVAAAMHGITQGLLTAAADPTILSVSGGFAPLPNVSWSVPEISINFLVTMCLLPLVTMLFFNDWVSIILEEKHEKLLLLMRMQGLRQEVYWVCTWAFNMAVYVVFTGVYIAMQYIVGNKTFEAAGAGKVVLVLLLWAHAQIGMAIFISALMPKSLLATTLTYVLIILQMLMAPILPLSLQSWPNTLNAIPSFAFIRLCALMFSPPRLGVADMGFAGVAGVLFAVGTGLLIVGIVLHAVPLSTLPAHLWRCLGGCSNHVMAVDELQDILLAGGGDVDVLEEQARVDAMALGSQALVLNPNPNPNPNPNLNPNRIGVPGPRAQRPQERIPRPRWGCTQDIDSVGGGIGHAYHNPIPRPRWGCTQDRSELHQPWGGLWGVSGAVRPKWSR